VPSDDATNSPRAAPNPRDVVVPLQASAVVCVPGAGHQNAAIWARLFCGAQPKGSGAR